jgi:hypothetical protein
MNSREADELCLANANNDRSIWLHDIRDVGRHDLAPPIQIRVFDNDLKSSGVILAFRTSKMAPVPS